MLVLKKKDIYSLKNFTLHEEVILKKEDIASCKDILEVKNVNVEVNVNLVSSLVLVNLKVNANLVLASTRTLKPVDFSLNDEDNLTLAFESNDFNEDDSEDIIKVNEDHYDLYNDVVSLIISSIPLKIIGKDDPEKITGDNWEVISEDEYNEKKKNEVNPAFSSLLDFDLED